MIAFNMQPRGGGWLPARWGNAVTLASKAWGRITAWALLAATVLAGSLLPRPAAAQVTIGSPGDPPQLALALGAFDIIPSKHPDSRPAADFRAEYRFGAAIPVISPFIGASGTSDGAFYGYFGFGIDFNLGRNWVLTPNVAGGYFARGSGTRLGSWWEFRSGAELDYRMANQGRLGIAFHHMSNAGLTRYNPGEESVVLVYTIPLR